MDSSTDSTYVDESTAASQTILSTLSSIVTKLPSTISTPKSHSIGFNIFCIVLSCLVLLGMTAYCIYLIYVQNSVKFIDYKIERKKENAYFFYFQ